MKSKISISIFVVVVIIFSSQLSFADLKSIETAIIKGDFTTAQKLAKQLLETNLDKSNEHEARYYLGVSHLRLNEFEEAQMVFSRLIKDKLSPELRDKAYLGLFDSYYLNDHYKKAHTTIKRLFKLSPKSEFLSLIYLKMARSNLRLARWQEARQFLKKIINGFPNSLEYHIAKQLLKEKQYFAVQVGAFLERKRAEQLASELKRKKEYAYIVETMDQQNRKFYRVRVGQLAMLDEAQRLKLRLSKDGYPTQIYP